jgi:hypothetical protein
MDAPRTVVWYDQTAFLLKRDIQSRANLLLRQGLTLDTSAKAAIIRTIWYDQIRLAEGLHDPATGERPETATKHGRRWDV